MARTSRVLRVQAASRSEEERSPTARAGKSGAPSALTLEAEMIDGAQRVEFKDVEVIAATYFTLLCLVGGKFVGVPSLKMLPGTDIARRGDRGRLILPRDVAERLGLV